MIHRIGNFIRASLLTLIGFGAASCVATSTSTPNPSAVPHAASPISVTDLNGNLQNPFAQTTDRKATVLLFITNDCPISNGYAPEIHRLCEAYMDRGIAFYLVYTDPDLSTADARKHYKDYAYKCPALLDAKHQLATKAGATVTPEAAVYLRDGTLVYRGRINDLYLDLGRPRYTPTTSDLKDVLESIAQNHPLTPHTTQAVGCPIPM